MPIKRAWISWIFPTGAAGSCRTFIFTMSAGKPCFRFTAQAAELLRRTSSTSSQDFRCGTSRHAAARSSTTWLSQRGTNLRVNEKEEEKKKGGPESGPPEISKRVGHA